MLPEVLESAAEFGAAQSDDGIGAADHPLHARPLEPGSNGDFAGKIALAMFQIHGAPSPITTIRVASVKRRREAPRRTLDRSRAGDRTLVANGYGIGVTRLGAQQITPAGEITEP